MIDVLSIQIFLLLIAGAIATYYDTKKGIIPNKITFSMIGIGIILSIATNNLIAFPIALVMGILTYGLFVLNKMGAGDAKFFIGISLILPSYHGFLFPFLVMGLAGLIGFVHHYKSKNYIIRLAPYIAVSLMLNLITLTFFGG